MLVDRVGTVPEIRVPQVAFGSEPLTTVEGLPLCGVDTDDGDSVSVISSELLDNRDMRPAERSPACPEPEQKRFVSAHHRTQVYGLAGGKVGQVDIGNIVADLDRVSLGGLFLLTE